MSGRFTLIDVVTNHPERRRGHHAHAEPAGNRDRAIAQSAQRRSRTETGRPIAARHSSSRGTWAVSARASMKTTAFAPPVRFRAQIRAWLSRGFRARAVFSSGNRYMYLK